MKLAWPAVAVGTELTDKLYNSDGKMNSSSDQDSFGKIFDYSEMHFFFPDMINGFFGKRFIGACRVSSSY